MFVVITATSISGQTIQDSTYYYFKGEKITIPIDRSLITVSCTDSDALKRVVTSMSGTNRASIKVSDNFTTKNNKNTCTFQVDIDKSADIVKALQSMKHVNYVGYHIWPDSPIHTTSRFGVKLHNLSDTIILKQFALQSNTKIIRHEGWGNWFTLEVTSESIADALICSNIFYESGNFKAVDPYFNFCFDSQSYTPTDSRYSDQWAIDGVDIDINVKDVWGLTKGAQNIKIAIIDNGINENLSELSSVNFVNSYNTVSNTGFPTNNHASAIAGIIAADHNHGEIVGIVPNISLMNIYNPMTSTYINEITSGIMWAVNNGADILNCSWGAHPSKFEIGYNIIRSEQLEEALDSALYQGRSGKGCVVVFASGNNGDFNCIYPANYNSDLLVVGSIYKTGLRDSISNYGATVDVVAPGDSVLTYWDNIPSNVRGTSFAAPHVAAVAGMILSLDENLTREQVVRYIERSAQKINLEQGIYENTLINGISSLQLGYGLVDANRAINTEFKDMNFTGISIMDGINIFLENVTCDFTAGVEVRGSKDVILKRSVDIPYGVPLLINTTPLFDNQFYINPYGPNDPYGVE